MNLDEYLEALRTYSEEDLEGELGVGGNYAVFFKQGFETLLKALEQSGGYIRTDEKLLPSCGKAVSLDYLSGPITIHVFDHVPKGFVTGRGMHKIITDEQASFIMWMEEIRNHAEKQLKTYTTSLMMHPKLKKENKELIGWDWSFESAVEVLEDIIQYIKKEKIPACFPNSIGENHVHEFDRIIYYEPE